MPLRALDHVNLYTTDLARLRAWYRDVLGMVDGERPPFSFPGAWLYVGDQPVVHMTEVAAERVAPSPRIEHFALRADGMADFLATLTAHGISYALARVPGLPVVQVNLNDPDGNHIHIDFAAEEAEGLS